MAGKLIFILGGIRSGKSAFAEKVTAGLGEKVTYIATARILDDEMTERAARHQERRPNTWQTVEEPLQVAKAIKKHGDLCDVIMIDCLTGLITNMLLEGEVGDGTAATAASLERLITAEMEKLAKAAKDVRAHVVIVSNEVGMTLVSDNHLGRQFQDITGRANQVVAGAADEAYLVVAGCPLDIKRGRG